MTLAQGLFRSEDDSAARCSWCQATPAYRHHHDHEWWTWHKTRPKRVTWAALKAMTTSPESVSMSKGLKKRGWSFVGPTNVYAFIQALGLVNDHVQGCSVREAALGAPAKLVVPGP